MNDHQAGWKAGRLLDHQLEVEESGRAAPVECETCGNRVLVKKNSLAQTSIQWFDSSRCIEFSLLDGVIERAMTPSCIGLRTSIESAVRAGAVVVPELE